MGISLSCVAIEDLQKNKLCSYGLGYIGGLLEREGHLIITPLGKICEWKNWLSKKENCLKSKRAVIGYSGFSIKEIQMCYNAFPILVKFGFIPLFSPLNVLLGKAMPLYRKLKQMPLKYGKKAI